MNIEGLGKLAIGRQIDAEGTRMFVTGAPKNGKLRAVKPDINGNLNHNTCRAKPVPLSSVTATYDSQGTRLWTNPE